MISNPTDPFGFNSSVDRCDSASLKWEKYKGKEIIPMWVADMDLPCPKEIQEALIARASHPVFGYTLPDQKLYDAIISHILSRFQWAVDPSWIVWLPGVVSGFNVACRSVGAPGDTVLTHTPVYPPFLSAPQLSNRKIATIAMETHNNRWVLPQKNLNQALSDKVSLFLLCNPQNPCGTVFSRKELTEMAMACIETNTVICSDEIHCDLVLDRDVNHIPVASISPEIANQTITLMAPSKTFNIPGMGCAYAIIPNKDIKRQFIQTMAGIVPHINTMGYVAATTAYQHGQKWLDALIIHLQKNCGLIEKWVQKTPGLKMIAPQATYLAWVDISALGIDNPVAFFESAGVGVSGGEPFGDNHFIRINFGCPESQLKTALERMSAALTSLPR